MAVRVDEVVTEANVIPEASSQGQGSQAPEWERREQVRAVMEQARRDALRTRAEGYDD